LILALLLLQFIVAHLISLKFLFCKFVRIILIIIKMHSSNKKIDPDLIIPNLYLSGSKTAYSFDTLKQHEIKSILAVGEEIKIYYPEVTRVRLPSILSTNI
jgi:hypothetical protein